MSRCSCFPIIIYSKEESGNGNLATLKICDDSQNSSLSSSQKVLPASTMEALIGFFPLLFEAEKGDRKGAISMRGACCWHENTRNPLEMKGSGSRRREGGGSNC